MYNERTETQEQTNKNILFCMCFGISNWISQIVYKSLMVLATPRLLRMSGIIVCPVLKNTVRNLKKYSTDKIKNSSTEPQADLREAKGQSL